jgi:hypothetical protein
MTPNTTTPATCPKCGRPCYAVTRDKFSPPCWPGEPIAPTTRIKPRSGGKARRRTTPTHPVMRADGRVVEVTVPENEPREVPAALSFNFNFSFTRPDENDATVYTVGYVVEAADRETAERSLRRQNAHLTIRDVRHVATLTEDGDIVWAITPTPLTRDEVAAPAEHPTDALRWATPVVPPLAMKYEREAAARDAAEHMQPFPSAVLAAVARGEIDLNAIARAELANRGLDLAGKWVGFEAAKRAQEVR